MTFLINNSSKVLYPNLKKAWDNHYGLTPKHVGEFKDKNGKWRKLPDFSCLFSIEKETK
jgi:hypothetical protein